MVTMDVGDAVDLQHDERALQPAAARALQLLDEVLAKGLDPQDRRQRVAAAAHQRRLEVGDSFPGSFQLAREPVAFATNRHRNLYRPAGRRA